MTQNIKITPCYPVLPCFACGSTEYWLTPWGVWQCCRCHPDPNREANIPEDGAKGIGSAAKYSYTTPVNKNDKAKEKQRSVLALKLKSIFADKAREKQKRKPHSVPLILAEQTIDTRQEIKPMTTMTDIPKCPSKEGVIG